MKCLDLTLATPEQNLAADEALLDACETSGADEVLRFWESPEYFIVVGYANKVDTEVQGEGRRANRVPILRRCSGGGTVVQGPGCLNYSLVLKIDSTGPTASITGTNTLVMQRHQYALQTLLASPVRIEGFTDLALGMLKFSGNAQRRRRNYLLFHGTFLLHFDLPLIERWLSLPSAEPAYRRQRAHRDFLTNLYLPSGAVKAAVKNVWDAAENLTRIPNSGIDRLVTEKYSSAAWNLKF